MKRTHLALLFSLTTAPSLAGELTIKDYDLRAQKEHELTPVDFDYRYSDFLTPEEVLQQSDPLPEKLTEATKFVNKRRTAFYISQLSHSQSFIKQRPENAPKYIEGLKLSDVPLKEGLPDLWFNKRVCNYIQFCSSPKSENKLRHNVVKRILQLSIFGLNVDMQNGIFSLKDKFVVQTAGFENQIYSKISSLGFDPFQDQDDILDDRANRFADEVNNCAPPCHQATSMVAYYLHMKKRLQGKKVQPVPTYPVQYGESTDFHDGNYVVVQPYLGEEYITANKLKAQELNQLIVPELLEDLADAVDAGAWNLTLPNLWVHKPTKTFHITDLEKPNNEGFGPETRWKTAVLNNGEGTEEARAWKWNHNRTCGYDAVRGSILEKLQNKDDMQQRWDRIKENRMSK